MTDMEIAIAEAWVRSLEQPRKRRSDAKVDVEQALYLRQRDPKFWTYRRLASFFGCSPVAVFKAIKR